MAFFKKSKRQIERQAFRDIVRKKTTQAGRKAYEEEAIQVAKERAKTKARRPSLLSSVGSFALRKVSQPRRTTVRRAPVRRRRTTVRRAPVRRRRTTVRRAPVRRRRTTVRRAPVRRRRTTVRRASTNRNYQV